MEAGHKQRRPTLVWDMRHEAEREFDGSKWTYENSTLLNDKKTVKARALPMPKPIV
jgi:hypothetical protein